MCIVILKCILKKKNLYIIQWKILQNYTQNPARRSINQGGCCEDQRMTGKKEEIMDVEFKKENDCIKTTKHETCYEADTWKEIRIPHHCKTEMLLHPFKQNQTDIRKKQTNKK